jgi:hypothetical protein
MEDAREGERRRERGREEARKEGKHNPTNTSIVDAETLLPTHP